MSDPKASSNADDMPDEPNAADAGRQPGKSAAKSVAPKAVVSRLSLYLRELQHLLRGGQNTVSSSQLGQLLGFTDAQVRKDLTYFGHFGHPGVGYRCDELVTAIKGILGTDREWTVAMVGVGNLGRALLGYRGFASQGFKIVAAFDVEASKTASPIDGIPVYPIESLPKVVSENAVTLGLIAVPAEAAQGVADQLIEAGVTGILNFAPVTLSLPEGVSQVGVDLATEMEQLCFSVANRVENR